VKATKSFIPSPPFVVGLPMMSPDDVENVDPVVQGKLELEFQLFGDVLQVQMA
jgi:hypothetical protein